MGNCHQRDFSALQTKGVHAVTLLCPLMVLCVIALCANPPSKSKDILCLIVPEISECMKYDGTKNTYREGTANFTFYAGRFSPSDLTEGQSFAFSLKKDYTEEAAVK